MLEVSRDNNLKIPKEIKLIEKANTESDILAVTKAISIAENKKYNEEKIKKDIEEDKDLESIAKLPFDANDLVVITVVKKLGAYIITVTEKSPKKFRGVFVNRMQNYSLEVLEELMRANFIRMDSIENKKEREEHQKEAIIKLKLLGYIALVAQSSGCILKKQYKQISYQISEAINLTVAWKKSDDDRWRKRNKD